MNALEVKIGDNVFLLQGGKIKHFEDHYTEPYQVLEVLGKGNAQISHKGKSAVVHFNRLQRSHVHVQK